MTYLSNLQERLHLKRLADTQGWKEDYVAFVCANHIYLADGRGYEVDPIDQKFSLRGNFHRWADLTTILDAPGMEGYALTILLSLAAPLMPFAGANSILCVPYGDTSARNIALRFAMSIWGDPDTYFIPSGTDIPTRIQTYEQHQHLPLVMDDDDLTMDELGRLSNEFARGAARTSKFSTASSDDIKKWCSLMLVPAKVSSTARIIKFVKDKKSYTPMLDYEVPAVPALSDSWREIDAVCKENYGVVGDCYAQWITSNVDALRLAIFSEEKTLARLARVQSDYRTLVALAACVSIAGQVAKKMGLIKFEIEPAVELATHRARQVGRYIKKA